MPVRLYKSNGSLLGIILIFCILVAVVAGFSVAAEASEKEQTEPFRILYQNPNIHSRDDMVRIHEFKLQDGTRCAALVGYQNSSLSCAWDIRVSPR